MKRAYVYRTVADRCVNLIECRKKYGKHKEKQRFECGKLNKTLHGYAQNVENHWKNKHLRWFGRMCRACQYSKKGTDEDRDERNS